MIDEKSIQHTKVSIKVNVRLNGKSIKIYVITMYYNKFKLRKQSHGVLHTPNALSKHNFIQSNQAPLTNHLRN